MIFKLKHILVCATFTVTVIVSAKNTFSSAEQQQVSIATPGLFANTNAFSIDLEILRSNEWSFPLPVGKARVVGDYSMEIETQKGDNVKAMFDGVVRLSRSTSGYDNVIVVRHDNGLETVYGHNAQNLVQVGDKVKAGQTIAIVGGDGGRTYCVFEMMVNGGRVNPEMIFDVKRHKLIKQTIICQRDGSRVKLCIKRDNGKMDDGNDATKDKREMAKTDRKSIKNADAFGDDHQFTINLSNYNPEEWSYPLRGSHVISPYGGMRNHCGVDIKTKPNDNILAAFDGVVVLSGMNFGYGNCIIIRHANGLETLYGHNSKNLVKIGDNVKAGQVIALTGRTGHATTEHLHFETRVNGRTFNPSLIFDHVNKSLKTDLVTFTKRSNGSVTVKGEKNYMAKGK
jgi:murein DD-endopeptidase MepM/ murein hydrolase activator NlpD